MPCILRFPCVIDFILIVVVNLFFPLYRSSLIERHEREEQKCGSIETRKREHGIYGTRKIATIAKCDDTTIGQSVYHTIDNIIFEIASSFPGW